MAIEFDYLFEEAMADLPEDKELAFAVFVQRVERILTTELRSEERKLGSAQQRILKRSAASHVVALMRTLGIELPIEEKPETIQGMDSTNGSMHSGVT